VFYDPFPCPKPQTSYNATLARTRAHKEVNFSQLKCLKICDIAWAILHNIAPSEKLILIKDKTNMLSFFCFILIVHIWGIKWETIGKIIGY